MSRDKVKDVVTGAILIFVSWATVVDLIFACQSQKAQSSAFLAAPAGRCLSISINLEKCIGKYDVINIKLDKTGGLTEALKLKEKAKTKKFDIMVGCMVGTSLAMAPALILAQNVKWVDLDGPLLMSEDRKHNLIYKNSEIQPASTELWG